MLTAAVFVFAAVCFTVLAPWQFDRHEDRSNENEAVQESLESEPEPLAAALDEGQPDEETQYTHVSITGEYLADREMVARLRTHGGEAAFEVLTPMRTRDGDTVVINRGYVLPDETTGLPDFADPPSGEVTVTARARMDEPVPEDHQVVDAGGSDDPPQTTSISSQVVAATTGHDMRQGYFQLDSEQPGVLAALPLPRADTGPFFSYALQWYGFGGMAILGWLYFTIRELQPGGALGSSDAPRGQASEKTGSTGTRRRRRKSVAQILAEDEEAEVAGNRR